MSVWWWWWHMGCGGLGRGEGIQREEAVRKYASGARCGHAPSPWRPAAGSLAVLQTQPKPGTLRRCFWCMHYVTNETKNRAWAWNAHLEPDQPLHEVTPGHAEDVWVPAPEHHIDMGFVFLYWLASTGLPVGQLG